MNTTDQPRPSLWWRWPLLPFAALLGGSLGAILLTLLQWFGMKLEGGYNENGWYYRYILPVISSAFFGWLYALISLYVAPVAKVMAATIMTTILGVLSALGLVLVWVNPRYGTAAAIQSTVGSIASMVAAIATIVGYKDEFTSHPIRTTLGSPND